MVRLLPRIRLSFRYHREELERVEIEELYDTEVARWRVGFEKLLAGKYSLWNRSGCGIGYVRGARELSQSSCAKDMWYEWTREEDGTDSSIGTKRIARRNSQWRNVDLRVLSTPSCSRPFSLYTLDAGVPISLLHRDALVYRRLGRR